MAFLRVCWPALLLAITTSHASIAQGADLSIQRLAFQAADNALQRGDSVSISEFRDYPLYPYLIFRDLDQRLDQLPAADVRAFLKTYADSPPARRLRPAWLRQLASAQRWVEFLQDYQPGGDVAIECWRRQALLNTDRVDEALQAIEQLWMSATALPDACDPLFKLWQERGGLTVERTWQRFDLAMGKGERRLARYLQGLLPAAADRAMAELWLQVDENPRLILETGRFANNNPHTSDILIHGLQRWSRSDSVTAAAVLDTLKQRYRLPENQVAQLERTLALFVASRGQPDGLTRLTALPPQQVNAAVREWRVRASLRRGDWNLALKWLDALSPEESEVAQWQYWRARTLEALGNKSGAQAIYSQLAGKRDYHGFLAADRLARPYQINHVPLQVPAQELDALEERLPGLQRARELYLLGRGWEARVEWGYAIRNLTDDDLKTAAKLAHRWGWHDQSILTLARTGYWDDLELRFPLPHRDQVFTRAQGENIDPAWIYAVMRQESIFQSDVKSPAGALGLMQLMPATGQRIARDLQLSLPDNYALLQADTNILLGAHYLRYALDKLQGNPLLATAAYNAGLEAVTQWLPNQGDQEADLWAETIPYEETRTYVKRVMEYATIYQQRLGQSTDGSMKTRMKPVQPNS